MIILRHQIKCEAWGTQNDAAEDSGLLGHDTAANKFFEIVAEFKHFGMTLINQNSIN